MSLCRDESEREQKSTIDLPVEERRAGSLAQDVEMASNMKEALWLRPAGLLTPANHRATSRRVTKVMWTVAEKLGVASEER